MSKLEPTRTYSNPTATEVVRRLLDERGVEWHDTKIGKGFITVYEHDGITWIVTEHSSGRLSVKGCVKPTQGHYDGMTPAQAIAATLGSCNCSSNCTNGERTETCHDKNGFDFMFGFECTVCGAMTDGYMLSPADTGHYKQFNFCPMCGRRVEQ